MLRISHMIRLAVFLGNTGRGYENTRHNAGFLLCSYLYPDAVFSIKFHSAYAKLSQGAIMKPLTLMNLSGTAVSEAKSFFKLKNEEILVVHDDMELALGTAVFQKGGGTKGHNGLKSIRDRCGGEDFFRLRIGIGRPDKGSPAVYVLSPFTESEKASLNALFSRIASYGVFSIPENLHLKV